MKIFNETKKNEIAGHARVTKNMFQRIIGLLFRKNFFEFDALVITPCTGIHSIGMRFEFDAVYLDRNLRVLKVFSNVTPNRVLPILFKVFYVAELPANTINLRDIAVNDVLKFSYE